MNPMHGVFSLHSMKRSASKGYSGSMFSWKCTVVARDQERARNGRFSTARPGSVIAAVARLRTREHGMVAVDQQAAYGLSTEQSVRPAKGMQCTDCPNRAWKDYFQVNRSMMHRI